MEPDTDSVITLVDDEPLDDFVVEEEEESPHLPDPDAKSELPASPERHFKEITPRGGRARKDGAPPGVTLSDKPAPLPRPKYNVYKSDATSPMQRSKAGYSWLHACQPWVKDRILIYVYREWPILKMLSDVLHVTAILP